MKVALTLLFVMMTSPALAYPCKNAKIFFDMHDGNAEYRYWDNSIHIDKSWAGKFPVGTQKFIKAHECGHANIGRSEQKADSFAIYWGRKEKWLKAPDIDAFCEDIYYDPDDGIHGSGRSRCHRLRREFYAPNKKRY